MDVRRGTGVPTSPRPPSLGDEHRPPMPIPRAGSLSSTNALSTGSSTFFSNSVPNPDGFDNFNRPPMPLPANHRSDAHPHVSRRTGGPTPPTPFSSQTSRPSPPSVSSTSMRLPPPPYSSLDHESPPVPSRRNMHTLATR